MKDHPILGKFNENVAAVSRSIDARQEELKAAYQRIARLEADLNECLEYFEDRYDVSDGDYGEPAPNKEMQLGSMIKETLHGPGAF